MNKRLLLLFQVIMLSALLFSDSLVAMRNPGRHNEILFEMLSEGGTTEAGGVNFSVDEVLEQIAIEKEIRRQQQERLFNANDNNNAGPQRLEPMEPPRNVFSRDGRRNKNSRSPRRRLQRRPNNTRKAAKNRKNPKKQAKGRKKAPKRVVSNLINSNRPSRQQNQNINDAFVRGLVNAGLVLRHIRLQDGSYIMQIRSVAQGDKKITGLACKNQLSGNGVRMKVFGGSTCPSMALRSAQFMINYVITENQNYLNRIQNMDDTMRFLQSMDNNYIPATSLHSANIGQILINNRLSRFNEYNRANKIALVANNENVTVVDSVEFLEGGSLEGAIREELQDVDVLKAKIRSSEDGFVHGFIVGTGTRGGCHWVGAAVTRRNGALYWFVCDSAHSSTSRLDLITTLAKRIS